MVQRGNEGDGDAAPAHGWSAWSAWGALARCAVCARWPARTVCDACLARFARPRPRCPTCALPWQGTVACPTCPSCTHQPPPLAACVAALDYAYPWDALVTAFKFGGQPGLGRTLAPLMRGAASATALIAAADLLVPMALSRERLATRGYNQAHELARRLAPRKADAHLLLRLRDTAAQTALDRAAREANVRGAFAVDPLRIHDVRDRRLLLVDDVMTSGASLHAAARVLLQAGAARVDALVLARTEAPG